MPVSPRQEFITPFADESMRLLRETWANPTMLAEELFAILQQGIPQTQTGPLTIHINGGLEEDFIKFKSQLGEIGAIDFNGNLVRRTPTTSRTSPTIVWSDPAQITVGTALSGTQLNAVANDPISGYPLAGTYEYIPPSGTVLGVGADQPLQVIFTPDNSTSYKRARKTVAIDVVAAPVGGFAFLQSKSSKEDSASGAGDRTISFDVNVAADSLVFAFFRVNNGGSLVISDSLGNTWLTTPDTKTRYCLTNGAGAMTITFNVNFPVAGDIWTAVIAEYSAPVTAAFHDRQRDVAFPADTAPTTTSDVDVDGTDNLMLGFVNSNVDSGTPLTFGFTPQATFTLRESQPTEQGNLDTYVFFWDNVSVSVPTIVSGTLDQNSSWECVGFSFKPS